MVKLLALLLLVSVVCGVPQGRLRVPEPQGRLRVPETGRSSLKSPAKNSPSDFLKSSVGQTNNEVSVDHPPPPINPDKCVIAINELAGTGSASKQ